MAAAELQVIEGGNSDVEVGSPAWATKVRKQAKTLSKTLETTYMDLGRILYQVYDTPVDGDPKRGPIYRLWGYETFSDYAENELNLKKRKAEYLRNIFYRLEIELVGMPEDVKHDLTTLGWSKIRELVRVLTLRNAADWAKKAKNCTFPELQAAIAEYKMKLEKAEAQSMIDGKTGTAFTQEDGSEHVFMDVAVPEPEKLFVERFMLYPEQKINVVQAIARAQELSGSDVKSNNLDLICLDFLATNDFRKAGPEQKERYMAKVEGLLGLKLVALNPKTKEIVYGHANLAALISEDENVDDNQGSSSERSSDSEDDS